MLERAAAQSEYSKFDPYLFNRELKYPHEKHVLFAMWGYTLADARWMQAEVERQAYDKYIAGDYSLGKLDRHGQRINIRIEIPRRDTGEKVSFISGWMMWPDGRIKLNTPYGGK